MFSPPSHPPPPAQLSSIKRERIASTDKSFSFLSADEIEKLKQENEKKIATITRETKKKFASSNAASDSINNNDQFDNEDEFYQNKNLIISQHELDDDDDDDEEDVR